MRADFLILLTWLPTLLTFIFLTWKEKAFSNRLTISWVSVSVAVSVLGACLLGKQVFFDQVSYYYAVRWIDLGKTSIQISFHVDKLTSMMLLLVCLIAGLVQVFSFTYMKDDEHFTRYFAYLGLFSFAMSGLVLTDNLLVMYVFWELVGLSSYLLICFWRENPQAVRAAQKAFLLNRIGDAGFLIAVMGIYATFQTLNIKEIIILLPKTSSDTTLLIIGFGLMIAGFGKSAQFVLASWLPDAMEGPTPVSALLHAATMVAAGVYLLARTHFLLPAEIQFIISFLGGLTAFMASFAAIAQSDIKKVLAFSTISQIGYMIIAIGTDTPLVAMFHLLTHAFFKACLFLCAGSVIHFLHHQLPDNIDAQDMRNMGGLRTKLPITFYAYTVAMLALSGIPLFSGFLSKDAILTSLAYSAYHFPIYYVVVLPAFVTALLTPIYMMRQYYYIFWKMPSFSFHKEKEPISFTLPLVVLAVGSLAFWYSLHPFHPHMSWFLQGTNLPHYVFIPILSAAIALFGLGFSWYQLHIKQTDFLAKNSPWYRFSLHFFYLDKVYDVILKKIAIRGNEFFSIADRLLDTVIHGIARTTVVVGFLLAWFDRVLVDGVVKISYKTVSFLGNEVMLTQKNAVQVLLKWVVMIVLVVALVSII